MRTYFNNISFESKLYLRYRGLHLIPSKSAVRELMEYGLTLGNCKTILEKGYAAPRKRSKMTEEIRLNAGKNTYNIVIAKSFSHFYKEEVWLVVHVGRFTR